MHKRKTCICTSMLGVSCPTSFQKEIWLFLNPAAFRASAILCSALQTSGHIPCVCTLAPLHQACVGRSASAREAVEPQKGMYTPSDTTAVPSVPPSTPAVAQEGDNSPLTPRRSPPSPCRQHCGPLVPLSTPAVAPLRSFNPPSAPAGVQRGAPELLAAQAM
jgi:hypothetical protein